MWWSKKTEQKPEKPKRMNRLTIYFTNGSNQWFEGEHTEKETPALLWRYFYKWFFSREQSEFFTLYYENGQTVILRKNIYSFRVDIR